MRLSAKNISAMLVVLALAAFQFDSDAQSRGNTRSSSSSRSSERSSSSVSRSSGSSRSSSSKSTYSKPSSSDRVSGNKPSSAVRPSDSASSSRPSGQSSGNSGSSVSRPYNSSRPRPDISPADRKPSSDKPAGNKPQVNKPSGNQPSVQRPSGNKPSMDRPSPDKPVARPEYRPKPGNHNKPISVHRPSSNPRPQRVHPRDRDFLDHSRPSYHWARTPHYYGYRVKASPVQARRHLFGGITYYIYDNVWYRPYNGYYMVCRPPYGTSLAAGLISDIVWAAVNISYYNTVANTYDTISENNAYIAQQNAVIAQNNAVIAAQNQAIAQSQNKAQEAYGLASRLGLVQSYAAADASYYYQDGVFYSLGADGQYYVIVPPAGALVERLPEDFDVIELDGNRYYQVDETVYQMVIDDGKPYFEVIGQMN